MKYDPTEFFRRYQCEVEIVINHSINRSSNILDTLEAINIVIDSLSPPQSIRAIHEQLSARYNTRSRVAPGKIFHLAPLTFSSLYLSLHVCLRPSGVGQAISSFLSHRRMICRFCVLLSQNSLRACCIARLFTSWISPR